MKRLISFVLLALIFSKLVYSQGYRDKTQFINNKSFSPKHSYDVLNYKLNLNIYNCFKSPYPYPFYADNTITFKVDSVLNYIKLDAKNTFLTIDSVRLSTGLPLTYNHTSDKLIINLNRTYNPGEIVDVKIYYHHNNVFNESFIVVNGLVFTDCEPVGARNWFPCWDNLTDKATTDITAKVPSNVLLAANGRLADSIKTADTIYYHWISRDPMSTYLIAIAGSKDYIVDIRYWHKPSNPLDSIPVRYYHRSSQNLSAIKDTILMFATFFSSIFGDYPFEKICYADVGTNSGGAMENQTLITMHQAAWNDWFFVPHELAHQWFGDLITCGTWADIWINEGFATYCELLAHEHFHGVNSYHSKAVSYANIYLSTASYSNIPIYNPPDWITGIIYYKPACVLYMLRNVIGDSLMFSVLKSFITDTNFTFKNATTDEFTSILNRVTGQEYSWFINEWIFRPGHPIYQNNPNIENIGSGNWRLKYTVKQIQADTTYFRMPVELKVKFANNTDTLLKFFNHTNNQLFEFIFNKQPDSVIFDPYNKIVLKKVIPYQFISAYVNQCSNNAKPINDAEWTIDTINISQQGIVRDVEVNVNINHTNDGDLYFLLYRPDGTCALSQFNGQGGQNYTATFFDDSATVPISQGTPPFTGRFKAQGLLSTFNNQQMAGIWLLKIYDINVGNTGMLLNWCLKIGYQSQIGVSPVSNTVPDKYFLFQNYPNPFNPSTNIRYQIANNGFVSLKIYDVLGREVATLVNENLKAGEYEVTFNGEDLPSGIYFYKLSAGDFSDVKRMVFVK